MFPKGCRSFFSVLFCFLLFPLFSAVNKFKYSMLRVARQTGRFIWVATPGVDSHVRSVPVSLCQVRQKTDWLGKSWRRFWGTEKVNKDEVSEDKASVQESAQAQAEEIGSSRSELVSTYGDDAPKISPVVILPVMRHPIFPGFMVYQKTLCHVDNFYMFHFIFATRATILLRMRKS